MHKRTVAMAGWMQGGLGVLLVALLLFIAGSATLAQSDVPTAREITADEVNAVARQIWCPLCSGVRLDACELKACEQMKEVIAIKLAEGEDAESIKAYFVEQYGPQVMGEPPRQGFNWLAWILPVVAVIAGGYFFWRTTQRMIRTPEVVAPATPVVRNVSTANPDDEYAQKLDEELAKYG